ncbi:MAG: outer membrane protein assembly factor BamA [Planctomycetes bacterium]|nr:outer membrane protein assembly factor BamA [Planctomycetota bacterium]
MKSFLLLLIITAVTAACGNVFAQDEFDRIRVESEGNAFIDLEKVQKIMRDELRAYAGSGFNESYLDDGMYNIQRHYKEKGYYFVKTSYTAIDDPADNKRVIHVKIEEGPVVYMKALKVRGNVDFTKEQLKEIWGRSVIDYIKGDRIFLESDIEGDKVKLLDYYHKRGYARAEVRCEYNFSDTKDEVTVYLYVTEGQKFFIQEVNLSGIEEESQEYMGRQMKRFEGDPFTQTSEDGLASFLKDLLANKGHPYTSIKTSSEIDEAGGGVKIALMVTMGAESKIKEIHLEGNTRTKDWVLRKHLLFTEGDRFTKWRLLEGQKKLLNSGYFKSAELTFDKVDETGENVDIFVRVAEQETGQIKFRAGYGYFEGFHSGVDMIYDNLDGRGKKIKGGAKISERGLKYEGQLYIPWIARGNLNMTFTPAYENREETSFTFLKRSMEIALSRTITKTTGAVGLRVESVDLYDIKASLPTERDVYQARSLFFDVTRDTRDDVFNPKYGTLWTAGIEYGGHMLHGTVDYYKASFKTSWYKQFTTSLIGAFSLSSGIITPTGDSREVPISKRFFLGGENTVRGFDQNMVGPLNADRLPFGGEAFLNANVELRPQIWEGLYGAVFFDAGNVWLNSSDYFEDGLRYGAGVGIRFVTPVGPFRFDAARNLDKKDDEGTYKFYVSVGFPF